MDVDCSLDRQGLQLVAELGIELESKQRIGASPRAANQIKRSRPRQLGDIV